MSVAFWYKIKHSGFGYKFLRHAKREKKRNNNIDYAL